MDWMKVYTDDVLNSDLKDSQILAVIKYQALYIQLENEPNERQLKRFLTKKEIEFCKNFEKIIKERAQSDLNSRNKKRLRDKKYYNSTLAQNKTCGGICGVESDALPDGCSDAYSDALQDITLHDKKNTAKNKSALHSDLSVDVADRLADLVSRKKAIKIHAQQKTSWAKEIDLLQKRDGVSDERIKKAIGWYEENAGGQYVPVIESGKAFREKFIKLEDAIKRSPASAESEIYVRHGTEYRGQEALYWKSVDADREAYNGRA